MRIEDGSGGRLDLVSVFLNESEARELRDSIEAMLADRAAALSAISGLPGRWRDRIAAHSECAAIVNETPIPSVPSSPVRG